MVKPKVCRSFASLLVVLVLISTTKKLLSNGFFLIAFHFLNRLSIKYNGNGSKFSHIILVNIIDSADDVRTFVLCRQM